MFDAMDKSVVGTFGFPNTSMDRYGTTRARTTAKELDVGIVLAPSRPRSMASAAYQQDKQLISKTKRGAAGSPSRSNGKETECSIGIGSNTATVGVTADQSILKRHSRRSAPARCSSNVTSLFYRQLVRIPAERNRKGSLQRRLVIRHPHCARRIEHASATRPDYRT